MDVAQVYDETYQRLLDRGRSLDDRETACPVPALPGWSVKDTYAHLCGLCADMLDGRTDGAGSPEWSGRQVAERVDASFGDVCDEWEARGPALVRQLDDAGEHAPVFVAFDVWSHEQDVLGALGSHGERDDARVRYLAGRATVAFDGRFRDAAAPAVRIVTPTADHVLGDGAPVVTLHTDDYEVLRILFSRRSDAQMRRARWEGDPDRVLDHLHLFELPRVDLDD